MTECTCIARWMERFRALLRYTSWSARRIHDEIQDHLMDDAARLQDTGLDREAAERAAVEAFGSPERIVQVLDDEGGPVLSPKVIRYLTPLAGVLVLPSMLWFAGVVFGLELGTVPYVLHNSVNPVLTLNPAIYQIALNLLVLGGPFLALGLVLLGATEVGVKRSGSALEGHFAFRLTKGVVIVSGTSVVMLLVMGGYFVLENGPCWWGITWC